MNIKLYNAMIFIALAAIAFSFNSMYLGVEFTLVLILALSPVFLAATRQMKTASAPDDCETGDSNRNGIMLIARLYGCFLVTTLFACLAADIAWSITLSEFPIVNFYSIEHTADALYLMHRITQSIMIMTNLLISWFMIRRFGRVGNKPIPEKNRSRVEEWRGG